MKDAAYLAAVAQLPCAICEILGFRTIGVHVHHARSGTGAGRRASDRDTIPLCPEHHQGSTGIHGLGTKAFARLYEVTEAELVARTRRLIDPLEQSTTS